MKQNRKLLTNKSMCKYYFMKVAFSNQLGYDGSFRKCWGKLVKYLG